MWNILQFYFWTWISWILNVWTIYWIWINRKCARTRNSKNIIDKLGNAWKINRLNSSVEIPCNILFNTRLKSQKFKFQIFHSIQLFSRISTRRRKDKTNLKQFTSGRNRHWNQNKWFDLKMVSKMFWHTHFSSMQQISRNTCGWTTVLLRCRNVL